MANLLAQLDVPLPRELATGAGNAVFVAGWCVASEDRIEELVLVLDGAEQPVAAHGMPRLDVLRALDPGRDPYAPAAEARGYRSGFWGLLVVGPHAGAGPWTVGLRARLSSGAGAEATVGTIAAAPRVGPLVVPGAPRVAICLAAHEPRPDLLRAQLESLRAQTVEDWVCIVSDDRSGAEGAAAIAAAVDEDPRFVVSRAPERLGFYRNFERALALAPADVPFVALCDQDDVWHPDKLATLLDAIGDARLAYSDARVVAEDGTVLSDTYWARRRNNHTDLRSLLFANAITGAASLVRREVVDAALPFPAAQFAHFHDHWLGLVALSLGDIAFVDRPLYDYVQHDDAVIGHAAANRMPGLRHRLARLRADPRERVRAWRLHYFVDVGRLTQLATVLLLRLGDRMAADKRRALTGFLSTEGSLTRLAALWVRGARELLGRPETLGAEWHLAYAFAWRRLLGLTARDRPARRVRLDAVPPPDLALRPGAAGVTAAETMAAKVAPLRWDVRPDGPARLNVLIPAVDLDHLFGGYIAKFNLARRLAELGERVRIVTVDPSGPLPADWRARVEAFEGLEGLFERVELVFGREADAVRISPADRFVATTFWTAYVADDAVRRAGGERFLYLIQEYEPFTVADEAWARLARRSYELAHTPLFSTELLREYFERHGLARPGALAFRNAITAVSAPGPEALAARRARRLLFYARPEAHAARNLFPLGMAALRRAQAERSLDGWELRGIGTTAPGGRLELGDGACLELLPRTAQGEYGALLGEHDVGLALMDTPHPSLVPIEMASAGLVTVTTTFENKTAEALAAISPNILGAAPTVQAVAAAIGEAVTRAADVEARAAGSAVAWARSWDEAFPDRLLEEALATLG